MTILRGIAITLVMSSTLTLTACKKEEPDLPTTDPMDKVRGGEGWKVPRLIAVSPGEQKPTAHHVQSISSGLHDVDLETPPLALVPINPSCIVKNPGMGGKKYLIIGRGNTSFSLMKKPKIPRLMTFNNDALNKLGQAQAASMKSQGVRRTSAMKKVGVSASSMGITDVFVTETSKPVYLALAGGGLYNFNLAPGVALSGIVIYTATGQAAVAGVPDHVPVNFVSKTHKATRGCWTRVQPRPDDSWSRNSRNGLRFNALKPHWKEFKRRVQKDIGMVPPENVISVSSSNHFLIGPPPTRYEDRLPYSAYAGKTIRYMAADQARMGTYEENKDYVRQVVDQYYEAHMKAGK